MADRSTIAMSSNRSAGKGARFVETLKAACRREPRRSSAPTAYREKLKTKRSCDPFRPSTRTCTLVTSGQVASMVGRDLQLRFVFNFSRYAVGAEDRHGSRRHVLQGFDETRAFRLERFDDNGDCERSHGARRLERHAWPTPVRRHRWPGQPPHKTRVAGQERSSSPHLFAKASTGSAQRQSGLLRTRGPNDEFQSQIHTLQHMFQARHPLVVHRSPDRVERAPICRNLYPSASPRPERSAGGNATLNANSMQINASKRE